MPTKKKKEEGGTSAVKLLGFTARFTPPAKDRLLALAQIRDQSAYLLIEEAFWDFWSHLPEGQRDAAEQIVATVEAARARFSVKAAKVAPLAEAVEAELGEEEPPADSG